jgi:hypothetical protein
LKKSKNSPVLSDGACVAADISTFKDVSVSARGPSREEVLEMRLEELEEKVERLSKELERVNGLLQPSLNKGKNLSKQVF